MYVILSHYHNQQQMQSELGWSNPQCAAIVLSNDLDEEGTQLPFFSENEKEVDEKLKEMKEIFPTGKYEVYELTSLNW